MIGHSCPFLEELPYIQTMYHKRITLHGAALAASLFLTAALAWTTRAPAQAPQPAAAQVPTAAAPPPAAGTAPAAAAGKPAEPPQEPPTEAERLIDLAIKKIAALKSVSADLVQNIVMLKQKFDIKGRYLKAPTSRTYLKLTVSGLPDSDGTMLQVCDGETLWEYQEILEAKQLSQIVDQADFRAPELARHRPHHT